MWDYLTQGSTVILAFATVVLAYVTSRAARDTSRIARERMKADLFASYISRWDSPIMRYGRSRLAGAIIESLPSAKKEIPAAIAEEVGVFFEEIGLLLKKDHLDGDFVWEGFMPYAQIYWDHAIKPLKESKPGYRRYFRCYEELLQSMDKLTTSKDEHFRFTPAELIDLLTVERDQPIVPQAP